MDAVTARFEALESAVARLDAENRSLRAWRRIAGFFMAATAVALGVALMPATPAVAQTTLEQRVQVLEQKLLYVSRSGREMIFNAVNVHIRNGGTSTRSVNSLGNLIVGFNERRPLNQDGSNPNVRTGSHNIIVGSRNNYSSYGGLVAGYQNSISGDFASVAGGDENSATGVYSSVSGGQLNTASGQNSSVSGGFSNSATGAYSWVSGGSFNAADGISSSVSGGFSNTAGGSNSSISGGTSRSVAGQYDWRAGELFQEQ